MRNIREHPPENSKYYVLNFYTYGYGKTFQFVIYSEDVERIKKILLMEEPEYSRRNLTFDDVRGIAVIIDLGNVNATKIEPFISWDDINKNPEIENIASNIGDNFAIFLDSPGIMITGNIDVFVNDEGVDNVTNLFETMEIIEDSIDEDSEEISSPIMKFDTTDGGSIFVVSKSVVAVLISTIN